jgi:hypothetical protein
MLKKIYGIDYNKYICGGIGSPKLAFAGSETIVFETEIEMLKAIIKLKETNTVDEIKPFVNTIVREEYKL